MVIEEGRLVVKPMRYHYRMNGWTSTVKSKYCTYSVRWDMKMSASTICATPWDAA